jgi:hypothetical protein
MRVLFGNFERRGQLDKLIKTNLKSPDPLTVRWGKAIVGAILSVISLLLWDYVVAPYLPWERKHFSYDLYVGVFIGVIGGTFHGVKGKWFT